MSNPIERQLLKQKEEEELTNNSNDFNNNFNGNAYRENNQNRHRAIGDIEKSIEQLKHYRKNFHRLQDPTAK
jgi:oligoribonuclease (3'-5' exoribonuclease)